MRNMPKWFGVACVCALTAATPASADSQKAWSDFTAGVSGLGGLVETSPMPRSEQAQAEGYRHLARMLSTYLTKELEGADPNFPRLSRGPGGSARIGWDNPDNIYISAPLRGDHTYRIRGNVGSVNFMSFNVYDGFVGKDGKGGVRSVGSINLDSLKTDADGNYELILSPEPHPGNWIKLTPTAYILNVRKVFNDWATERQGPLEIVNLTTQGTYPEPLTEKRLAEQLQKAVVGITELRSFFNQNHARLFQKENPVNTVTTPSISGVGLGMDDPQNNVSVAQFKLAPDEALVLTVPAFNCVYNNIQLANLWWESLDYANHQSHLNGKMAGPDADGNTRYVISRQDPGTPNWLDTVGHEEGTLFMRWTQCSQAPARVESKVVKLSQVRSLLPRETPVVTAEQRKQAIDLRQGVFSRRLAGGG